MKNTRYDNIVEFQVTGDYALFSDPILRVGGEKCSYQVPTYEALKGILQSVYWKPTIIWVIDAVRVMHPIQMETKGIRPIKYSGGNDLSYYTYLKDCCYQVRAHFEWNENRPELAFGLMYHGITYADEAYSKEISGKMTVRFWNPVMKRGVITFLPPEQCPQYKTIGPMNIKPFGEKLNNFSGLQEFEEGT